MKLKKLLAFALVSVMSLSVLAACGSSSDGDKSAAKKLKVGVFLYKFEDTYISNVRLGLEAIEKENKDTVQFTFYDGKGDQQTQNDSIDNALSKDVDLLMVNLQDSGAAKTVLQKIEAKKKPVVFFNREPLDQSIIKSYDKAIFVGTNAKEAGVLQGEMIKELWDKDKKILDRDGDGKVHYVMLKGEPDNPEAVARTKWSVDTAVEKGVPLVKQEEQVCNWETSLAQNAVESWLSKAKDKIELVIANNDGMAQGAITALQAQGFNKGGTSTLVPVYGVDAVEAATDLINRKQMSGTVVQDAKEMAKALYEAGKNLAAGKKATDGTNYKFDDTGYSIRIPYHKYTGAK